MFSFLRRKSLVKRAALTGAVLVFLTSFFFVSCADPGGETLVSAQTPVIIAQPAGGSWNVMSANTFDLSVTAIVTDGRTLTYQWYSNTVNNNSGGAAIHEGTGTTLTLDKAHHTANGNYYFYVVVTNTNNNATTTKVVTKTSNVATVTVSGGTTITTAEEPNITVQPVGGLWNVGTTNTFELTVTVADVTDGGTLTYQWYSNSTNSNSGGTAITTEGTSATLTLAKTNYTTDGSYYFYMAVTNTNNNATTTKIVTKTSNAVTVTVSGNSGSIPEVVIPANITGFFQTEIDLYPMAYYDPSTSSFYFDGFSVNSETKKFYYYMDSTLETYWGGTIVSTSAQGDTEPAVLIIRVEEVVGSFYTIPETGKYLAYAYKNPAGGIVSTASAYSSSAGAKNTGVNTIAEAVSEYTAANGYFDNFGTYLSRPFSASAFGGVKGKWEQEEIEDYFIIIKGTTFIEFYDDYEDGNIGNYDPDDDYDMLASIGTIVDCTDTSQSSGVLYIKVIGSDVYTVGSYIAVAWKNKTANGIDFATGNNSKSTLAEIKTTYGNISAFPAASFNSYEK